MKWLWDEEGYAETKLDTSNSPHRIKLSSLLPGSPPGTCCPWKQHCSPFPTQINVILVPLLVGRKLWSRFIKIQKCLNPVVNKMPLKVSYCVLTI